MTTYNQIIEQGFSYARLNQFDIDGKVTSYGPIGLNCNSTEVSIYPNPGSNIGYLKFESDLSEDAEIMIKNSIGQIVYNESFTTEKGANTKTINSDEFKDGIYFIELNIQNNFNTFKWIIKH
jgi:hypothetical protein